MKDIPLKKITTKDKAQGMVEFALVLPLLLFVIFGVIEAGRLLLIYASVSTASRDAARYGAAVGKNASNVNRYQDCAGIRSAAKKMGALVGIQDADILISYDHGPGTIVFDSSCPASPDPNQLLCRDPVCLGDRVSVQVAANYQPLLPLVRFPPFPITSTSSRTVLKDVSIEGTPASPGPPAVWFTPVTIDLREGEYGTQVVRVELGAPTAREVRVPFTVSGSAAPGHDYSISPGGLVDIPPGEISADITIQVFDDNVDEDDETIILIMGTPLNANPSSPTAHTSTIIDDDETYVSFSAPGQSLPEAVASYSAPIAIHLSNPSSRDVTVPFSVTGGSAAQGSDYTLSAGPVTIPAGSQDGSIIITLPGDDTDSIDEDDETVVVEMGNPTNATKDSPSTHTVTILDNDNPPAVQFTWPGQEVTETVGNMFVEVKLSAASGKTVTVPVSVGGTATSGEDYALQSALPLEFLPGTTTQTIKVAIVNDLIDELVETIEFSIGTPTNADPGDPSTHIASITNIAAPPTVTFAVASQSTTEGAGSVNVLVQLSAASGLPVTVPFSISGTAAQGTDFTYLPSGQVTIPPGSASAAITLNLVDDTIDEDDETVVVTMGTPVNALQGAPSTDTVTILDNDTTTVAFARDSQSLKENLGVMAVLVQLTAPSSKDVTVPFTLSGTATQDSDFTLPASPVTIPAGSLSASIPITILDDLLLEPDETVILTLGTPTNAGLGTPAVHTATILDNDAPVCPTASALRFYSNSPKFDMTLYNNQPGSTLAQITSMVVFWLDGNGKKLMTIDFGGVLIWTRGGNTGNTSPTSISINDWISGADRTLYTTPPGDVKTLVFTLDYPIPLNEISSYQVTVNFSNGCPSITR